MTHLLPSSWEEVTPAFLAQLGVHTGPQLFVPPSKVSDVGATFSDTRLGKPPLPCHQQYLEEASVIRGAVTVVACPRCTATVNAIDLRTHLEYCNVTAPHEGNELEDSEKEEGSERVKPSATNTSAIAYSLPTGVAANMRPHGNDPGTGITAPFSFTKRNLSVVSNHSSNADREDARPTHRNSDGGSSSSSSNVSRNQELSKHTQTDMAANRRVLDRDRMCSVIDKTTRVPCSNSLMCTLHSERQKRSVHGRSALFRDLLQKYNDELAQHDRELEYDALHQQFKTVYAAPPLSFLPGTSTSHPPYQPTKHYHARLRRRRRRWKTESTHPRCMEMMRWGVPSPLASAHYGATSHNCHPHFPRIAGERALRASLYRQLVFAGKGAALAGGDDQHRRVDDAAPNVSQPSHNEAKEGKGDGQQASLSPPLLRPAEAWETRVKPAFKLVGHGRVDDVYSAAHVDARIVSALAAAPLSVSPAVPVTRRVEHIHTYLQSIMKPQKKRKGGTKDSASTAAGNTSSKRKKNAATSAAPSPSSGQRSAANTPPQSVPYDAASRASTPATVGATAAANRRKGSRKKSIAAPDTPSLVAESPLVNVFSPPYSPWSPTAQSPRPQPHEQARGGSTAKRKPRPAKRSAKTATGTSPATSAAARKKGGAGPTKAAKTSRKKRAPSTSGHGGNDVHGANGGDISAHDGPNYALGNSSAFSPSSISSYQGYSPGMALNGSGVVGSPDFLTGSPSPNPSSTTAAKGAKATKAKNANAKGKTAARKKSSAPKAKKGTTGNTAKSRKSSSAKAALSSSSSSSATATSTALSKPGVGKKRGKAPAPSTDASSQGPSRQEQQGVGAPPLADVDPYSLFDTFDFSFTEPQSTSFEDDDALLAMFSSSANADGGISIDGLEELFDSI